MLTLVTSSVNHEMVTPLKCVQELALQVLNRTADKKNKSDLNLIVSSC
jgi:hypothetical protein